MFGDKDTQYVGEAVHRIQRPKERSHGIGIIRALGVIPVDAVFDRRKCLEHKSHGQ